MSARVTGPDGDTPITDDQVRDLLEWSESIVAACKDALRHDVMIVDAREQCAAAWNACHKEVDRG